MVTIRGMSRQAGIEKDISPHSVRFTGIASFFESDGEMEAAQRIATHSGPCTTKRSERRDLRIVQGEVERVRCD